MLEGLGFVTFSLWKCMCSFTMTDKTKITEWLGTIDIHSPNHQMMEEMCRPNVRPIAGKMVSLLRPAPEVQHVRRTLLIDKIMGANNAEVVDDESKNKKIKNQQEKLRLLEVETNKKKTDLAKQQERIQKLKKEIKEKDLRVKQLQEETRNLRLQERTLAYGNQQHETRFEVHKNVINVIISTEILNNTSGEHQTQESPPSLRVEKVTSYYADAKQQFVTSKYPPPLWNNSDANIHFEHVETALKNKGLHADLLQRNNQLESVIDHIVQAVKEGFSEDIDSDVLKTWVRLQLEKKKVETFRIAVKEQHTDPTSLNCDRDYHRLLLLRAEKKLAILHENYLTNQKEFLESLERLSCSWERVEETSKEAQNKLYKIVNTFSTELPCLFEITEMWHIEFLKELQMVYEAVRSKSQWSDPLALLNTLDKSTACDGMNCVLELLSLINLARSESLIIPKVCSIGAIHCLEEILEKSGNLKEVAEQEKSDLESFYTDLQHIENENLKQLLWIWSEHPFEQMVPETVQVDGKNLPQHTARVDRAVACFFCPRGKEE